jgi:hypothetical protein
MEQVQADSGGKAKMGPGTLYGSMGRMYPRESREQFGEGMA